MKNAIKILLISTLFCMQPMLAVLLPLTIYDEKAKQREQRYECIASSLRLAGILGEGISLTILFATEECPEMVCNPLALGGASLSAVIIAAAQTYLLRREIKKFHNWRYRRRRRVVSLQDLAQPETPIRYLNWRCLKWLRKNPKIL